MAGQRKQVVYSRVAHEQILSIMLFIAQKGYPQTSLKFCDQLYDFGSTLGSFPEKFPVCYHRPFKKEICVVPHLRIGFSFIQLVMPLQQSWRLFIRVV